MAYYVPGTSEKDLSKVITSLQQAHNVAATNTTNIATNTTDIATNTADIAALQALVPLTALTNSLSGDVLLNNTASYFDGPSVAQGTSGTWFVSGAVTIGATASNDGFHLKLWDGATVIDSRSVFIGVTGSSAFPSLSGIITSPAGNLRISVRDVSSTTGKILFNSSGNSKDSTITAVRIA